jgi:hypothetical protein
MRRLDTHNKHPLDTDTVFTDAGHHYHHKGVRVLRGVTATVAAVTEGPDGKFDVDAVIAKCYNGWTKKNSRYYKLVNGVSKSDGIAAIKAEWATANVYGTYLHAEIERACNRVNWKEPFSAKHPEIQTEFAQWFEWASSEFVEINKLVPYRTEWPLVELLDGVAILAGTPDAVFVDKNKKYWVFDWKRVVGHKSISADAPFFSTWYSDPTIPRNDHTKFSLQVSLYAEMLPWLDIGDRMYIVRMHSQLPTAETVKCTNFRTVAAELIEDLKIEHCMSAMPEC